MTKVRYSRLHFIFPQLVSFFFPFPALPPPKRESVTPPALQKHPFRPSHPAKSGIWGCLNHYPTHSSEGLPKKTSAVKSVKEKGKRFIMNGGTKSTPIRSVVCMNVPLRQSAYKLSTYA
eukprot:Sdes_comp20273_c0_seq2m13820